MSRHGTRSPNSTWTAEQEQFLRENHETLTLRECASHLGKNYNTVCNHFRRIGLSKGKRPESTGKNNPRWGGCGDISANFWNKYKHGANKRSIGFEISIEEGWALFEAQDGKCALSGIEIKFRSNYVTYDGTASLDRKDSLLSYSLENCQWVHKVVNNMKQSLTDEEFIVWCQTIANHNAK